jgi:hypothetical protein
MRENTAVVRDLGARFPVFTGKNRGGIGIAKKN